MADDGMLVNFDIGSEPLKFSSTFKGGRWKDRLSAKKAAEYHRAKRAKNSAASDEHFNDSTGRLSQHSRVLDGDVNVESPPVKRQRIQSEQGDEVTTTTVNGQNVGSHKWRGKESSSHKERQMRTSFAPSKRSKPHQVVSSLFSFNPKATTAVEKVNEDNTKDVEPSNAPLDSELQTFTSLGLSRQLAEHLLHKLSIKAPTGIQSATVLQLLKEDTDAFVQAETGSGKTLAYLLPIVQRLMLLDSTSVQRNSGLFAIILAPTRELSKQISVVLESLLRCAHWIVSGTVIGGEKKKSEKARLRKGLNILIATPGRLVDHLDNTEVLDVSNVRWLVLDEGDRLMELGFEQDLRKILSKLDFQSSRAQHIDHMPRKRTTILCSATMKTNVQRLGELSLKDAVHIHVSKNEKDQADHADRGNFAAPAQLQQSFAIVPAKLRLVSLVAVLKRAFVRRGSVMKVIVFISCADSVDFHFEVFTRSGDKNPDSPGKENKSALTKITKETNPSTVHTTAPAIAFGNDENKVDVFRLHGSLPQATRTATLASFSRNKSAAVLVCTDVAARGLDLPNVDFVVEYDPPFNKDDHLHRVGRTARAGKDGRAMIFLMPGSEESYIPILKSTRHDEARNITRHDSDELLLKGFGSPGLGAGRDWEERATDWQLDVERWALENPQVLEQARRAYQSHVRAYATHVAAERHIFDMMQLHLGHLAKAFALRDRPGSIKVPGLRPNKKSIGDLKAERNRANFKSFSGSNNHDTTSAEKMRQMVKHQSRLGTGVSEFNLG